MDALRFNAVCECVRGMFDGVLWLCTGGGEMRVAADDADMIASVLPDAWKLR